jgi:hypothetical protein
VALAVAIPPPENRAMKLNFWQWLGLVLLVIAVVLIFRKRMGTGDTVPAPVSAPPPGMTTAPAP